MTSPTAWPLLTVAIVTYNRKDRLKATLDHVLADDYPNREIVVVDGGSKDGTQEMLASYGERVRWISEKDRGEYDAWNKANGLARGEIVKWLPDDDRLRHGAARKAVEYLQKHPEVEMLWGQCAYFAEQPDGSSKLLSQTAMVDPKRLSLRHFLRQQHGLSSVALFVRRRVFEQLGPFRIDLACGDTEYWARAAARGLRMAVVPDVFADYNYGDQNGVIRLNWRISRDLLKIVAMYGTPADVAWTVWTRRGSLAGVPTLRHEAGKVAHRYGFHPLRTIRRARERLGV